jgi:uncharacterized membrane protein YgcG
MRCINNELAVYACARGVQRGTLSLLTRPSPLSLSLFSKDSWYVVELNPFLTSSAGHRFTGAEYAGLADRTLAEGELPEMRLLERTPAFDKQTAAAVPPRWRELLLECGDVYDIAEADYGGDGGDGGDGGGGGGGGGGGSGGPESVLRLAEGKA